MITSKKLSKQKNISHGFFNRAGGKSIGIYKSLNCGLGSKDKKSKIRANLKIVKDKISKKSKNIFLLHQIHSNKFVFIDKNFKFDTKKIKADAVITDQPKIPIGILTADCVPILLHDNKRNMIAAIHAGWKGALKDVIKKVVQFMIKKGCSPESMTAAVGPCIALKNYEVKQDFIKRFIKKDKKNKIFFKKIKKKNYFGLNRYIFSQLKSLDIKSIEIINKDTFDEKNNFFSARRSIGRKENDYGRNISVIMIN